MRNLVTIACFFASTTLLAQEKLPEDVRRFVPKKTREPSTKKKVEALEAKPTAKPETKVPDDQVDDHMSRALLRYRNIAESSVELNDAWHLQMSNRLERVQKYLESLRKRDAERERSVRPKSKPKPPGSGQLSTGVTLVQPAESTQKPTDGLERSASKIVFPPPTSPAFPNRPPKTDSRAHELRELAKHCEVMAKQLRAAAREFDPPPTK